MIHRTDGAHCESPKLRIGKVEYEPWEIDLRSVAVDLTRATEQPVDDMEFPMTEQDRWGDTDIFRDSQHVERGELTEPGKFDT